MTGRAAWIVYVKELRDAFRDRRAWLIVLVSAVVAGPATLLLLSGWVKGIEEQVARREIVLTDPQSAPTLANYIARNGGSVVAAPPDYEAAVAAGRLLTAVFEVPVDFEARLARGETVRIGVVYDDRQDKAQSVVRSAMRLVQSFNRELGAQRLMARGVSPRVQQALELDERNLAPARARGAQMLFLVPWVALLVSVAGAIAVAIDVTAGERERGSLEPLLASPVPVMQIVLGKWAAVATFAMLIAALTLAGFAAAMPFIRDETLSALLRMDLPTVALFGALLAPFAMLMAAVNMLAASFGRSFKEAQTTVSYIVLLVNLAPLAPLFLDLGDSPWLRLVPAVAQQTTLMKSLRGTPLATADVLLPAAVCLLLALVALLAQARLLRREDVVFARG
jgi:sodium transport system permease protein